MGTLREPGTTRDVANDGITRGEAGFVVVLVPDIDRDDGSGERRFAATEVDGVYPIRALVLVFIAVVFVLRTDDDTLTDALPDTRRKACFHS